MGSCIGRRRQEKKKIVKVQTVRTVRASLSSATNPPSNLSLNNTTTAPSRTAASRSLPAAKADSAAASLSSPPMEAKKPSGRSAQPPRNETSSVGEHSSDQSQMSLASQRPGIQEEEWWSRMSCLGTVCQPSSPSPHSFLLQPDPLPSLKTERTISSDNAPTQSSAKSLSISRPSSTRSRGSAKTKRPKPKPRSKAPLQSSAAKRRRAAVMKEAEKDLDRLIPLHESKQRRKAASNVSSSLSAHSATLANRARGKKSKKKRDNAMGWIRPKRTKAAKAGSMKTRFFQKKKKKPASSLLK